MSMRAATQVVDDKRAVPKKLTSKGLFSSSATYLLSNILGAAVPLALLPILTRYLTTAQYGEVAMFQTLLAVLGAVTGLSVTGAAARKYYDVDLRQDELKFFIGSCFQILLVSGVVALVGLYAIREDFSRWIGLPTQWILLACCSSAANFAIQMRMGQWQVSKNARLYGLIQLGQSAVNVIFSLLLVVAFQQAASGRIWAQVITALAFSGVALGSLHRDGLLGFAWRPRYLEEALGFGVPLVPHALGLLLLGLFDRLMINARMGLTEVGVYMVAAQLASSLGLIFDAINKAYVPWLFERLKRDRVDEKQQIVSLTYWYFFIALSMAGSGFLFGPIAVSLIAGERYEAAGEAIGWLMLGQAFTGMYLMVTNYIFYSKRTGLLALVTFGSGVLNVALLWHLIGRWGLVGAAVAFALAMCVRFVSTWYLAQRRHPMPWFNFNLIA